MKVSRRKFLGLALAGVVTLVLGRFLKLFKAEDKKVARYWRQTDKFAG